MVFMGLVTAMLGAAAPFAVRRFGVGVAASGLPVTVYSAGSAAAVLALGTVARRIHPVRAMTWSVLVFGVGAIGLGLAPSWPSHLTAAAVAGAGFGGLVLFLNTAFSSGGGRHDVLVLNLLNAVYGVGAVTGPLAVGAIGEAGLPVVFVVAGLACLPGIVARSAGELIVARPSTPDGPIRGNLAVIGGFVGFYVCYTGLETGTGTWESSFLVAGGLTPARAATFTALFWAGLSVGRIILPLVGVRLRPRVLVVLGVLLSCCGLIVAMVPGLGYAGFAFVGFALGPVFPTAFVWVARALPGGHTISSILLTADTAGNAVTPALIGLAVAGFGAGFVPVALIVMAGGALATAALTHRCALRRDRGVDVHSGLPGS